jgi:Uma2 family endonuclease
MTVDQYFRTPEALTPMELVVGVLRVADAPMPRHQAAVFQLGLALHRHVRERRLGRIWLSPLDVVLDERRALVVQPDLLFIANERDWIVQDRIRGAPDLVVEVLSPHPRIGRIDERVRWFAQYGVRECWLVHQDRRDVTVIGFRDGLVSGQTVFRGQLPIQSGVLPDFSEQLDRCSPTARRRIRCAEKGSPA